MTREERGVEPTKRAWMETTMEEDQARRIAKPKMTIDGAQARGKRVVGGD
jgi:hypothetical protein